MKVLYDRCCGLDIHKKLVTACLITPDSRVIKTFGTMTSDLLELVDWLCANGCTHAAMESTGVYWKPIYNLLEESGIQALVVNAQHIKNVPGRKTDVKDAEWIADLLQHGLVRGSYIPDRWQRELRELVRYRRSLIEERARESNRIQKVLEGANIKLGDVASNVLGKSGRSMLDAIVSGVTDPDVLSELVKGRLVPKKEQIAKSLQGLLGKHQRMMLQTQLRHVDFLTIEIDALSREIEEKMHPFDAALEAIDAIPGISRRSAEQILCETGIDMSRFPTAAHFASWAGLCPGNNESAGKRRSGATRNGCPALKTTLVQVAQVSAKVKSSYFAAMYRRIASRRGANRAKVAVAHAILTTIYYMLKNKTPYQELGAQHYEDTRRRVSVERTVRRLETLGYRVTLERVA